MFDIQSTLIRTIAAAAIIVGVAGTSPAPRVTVTVRAPNFMHPLAKLSVTSTTFASGGALPVRTEFGPCGGKNVSPQLSWSGAPAGTKSYFVTAFDPDAPTSTGFWHWTIFNLPATVTSLAEDAAAHPPASAVQGRVDYGMSGYGGPCPPPGDGPHHYRFTVYALDVPQIPGGTADSAAAALMFSIQASALASGTYTGTFEK